MGSEGFESKKARRPAVRRGGNPKPAHSGRIFQEWPERIRRSMFLSGLGDTAASLVEISGVIKWFDASKGYGFHRSGQWMARCAFAM